MPLFNGNLLQLHALLVAAYSGVSKGIANKGLKPDVTRTYPQQYGKWYSMNGDERNEEHTALYNEWKNKVLRKIHAEVGGSAEEAGQQAFTEQPDGTSNQNRARAREAARNARQTIIDNKFEQAEEYEVEARSGSTPTMPHALRHANHTPGSRFI